MTSLSMKFDGKKYSYLHAPHDMCFFLYKGAVSLNMREVARRLASNSLGSPIMERYALVSKLHQHLEGIVASGRSESSFDSFYDALRNLFRYIDANNFSVDLESIEGVFVKWGRDLVQRYRRRELQLSTVKHTIGKCAVCIGEVIGVAPSALRSKCRIPRGKRSGPSKIKHFGAVEDFVDDLTDFVNLLSVDVTQSNLPIAITCKNSDRAYITYAGLAKVANTVQPKNSLGNLRVVDTCAKCQRAIINLRLMCEIFLFIFHSTANLTQVGLLRLCKIRSSYKKGGFKYIGYKARKGGEVEYSIPAECLGWYEEYLQFRDYVVKQYPSDLLFPLIRNGNVNQRNEVNCSNLRLLMKVLDRPYVPPSALRKYKLNRMLAICSDLPAVSSLGQHDQRTFLRNYFVPNQANASREWTGFFAAIQERRRALMPGGCAKKGEFKQIDSSTGSPLPDCVNPSGCIFCVQYRGSDSLDYIWSLLTYKELKTLEYQSSKMVVAPERNHPLELVVSRVAEIEASFCKEVRDGLALHSEASVRIKEEFYHPDWAGYIELMLL